VINFLGFVKDIPRLYQRSDIAVLPSYGEGFPKSLLEASSVGLPVVASNVPGCRDLITNMKNGLICMPKDANDLAKKIDILINDQKLCLRLGDNGAALVREIYGNEIIAWEHTKIYQKYLN
jgi:N,N'-diacetylbacillosaminyl-diphospho-undecaprenol alpha-1,3-N-acetylgalactosaminyltransferase